MRMSRALLILSAVGAMTVRYRAKFRPGASGEEKRDGPGPPAQSTASNPPRVVVTTPVGELTDDPAAQWADDGGGGMGGGQRQV